jgi:hypothetical protein
MVFDDTEPVFDTRRFKECDWSKCYPEAKEVFSPDMPIARGRSVVVSCFVEV